MKNKQKIAKSNIVIDVIDKIDLIKVDVTFMSNLLSAWDIKQMELTYKDMFGMSRICDSINIQLKECADLMNSLNQKQKR